MDSLDVRKKSRINGRGNRSADQVEARRNRFLWLPCSKRAKLQCTAAMRESESAEQVEADRVRTRQLRAAMRVNGYLRLPPTL
jgi:hypothetical protein